MVLMLVAAGGAAAIVGVLLLWLGLGLGTVDKRAWICKEGG